MKTAKFSLAVLLFCSATVWAQAPAQAAPTAKPNAAPSKPPTTNTIVIGSMKGVAGEFVPAAEAMPEDKYDFVPTNGEFKTVRSFAKQVKHIASSNYDFCASIEGGKPPVDIGTGEDGPDAIKSKDDIVKFLKDSYAYCYKVYESVPGDQWITPRPVPGNTKGRTFTALGVALLNQGHNFDHYGQVVEYLRMNGIVPPASRGQ